MPVLEALRLFVTLIFEGGSYWAQEMVRHIESVDEWDERALLNAHLIARNAAWERSDTPNNSPNIPTLSFDHAVTFKYVTCRGTEIEMRGSLDYDFRVCIAGKEASVLRRALSFPEGRQENFWDSQSQMQHGHRFAMRLEELLESEKEYHEDDTQIEGVMCVPSLT